MLWSLVAAIGVLTISEAARAKHSTSSATTTTSSSSPESFEPVIPDTDLSSIKLNIDNSNDNNDNDDSTSEEDAELERQLSSIIDESPKTSKSKKNSYKSKYLLYIMSRNSKKKEYKEYVKNNKKEKVEDKFNLYISSDEYINELNENSNDGAIYNHTKFSDWSIFEKKAILLTVEQVEGQHGRRRRRMLANCYSFAGWGQGVSGSVSYRSYAQPIQDQGDCGSCWDFSSIAQYEFNYLKYKGVSQKQSEQYVLDCVSDSVGNCADGGFPDLTNRWLAESGSCPCSSYYTYDATEYACEACWSSKTPTSYVACITQSSTGYATNSNTFWSIIANAAQYVSLSIGMLISNNFYYLSSSSPYLYSCDTNNIIGGHAMAIYGVDASGNNMLVKNSWSTDWGDGGYFWLSKTTKDSCDLGDFSFNYW
jgi:C1A family cysteine protease